MGNTLFVVIEFVFSILFLILFFKIWGMTNDVKKIKIDILSKGQDLDEVIYNVKYLHYVGRNEDAYNVLNKYVFDCINRNANIFYRINEENNIAFLEDNSEVFSKVDGYYKAINKEIPDAFKDVTLKSFRNFGTEIEVKN